MRLPSVKISVKDSRSLKIDQRDEGYFVLFALVLAVSYTLAGIINIDKSAIGVTVSYLSILSFSYVLTGTLVGGFIARLAFSEKQEDPFFLPALFTLFHAAFIAFQAFCYLILQYTSGVDEGINETWSYYGPILEGTVFLWVAFSFYKERTIKNELRIFLTTFLMIGALSWHSYYFPEPYFVVGEYDYEYEYDDNIVDEEFFELQREKIEETVSKIVPSQKGVVDFYAIIGGGDPSQGVFLKEAILAQTAFDKNLSTKGRSIVLVNKEKDINEYPSLNITNIKSILRHLKRKMQPNEDVLVIYLTSHGGKDSRLTVSVPYVELESFTAAKLDKILDEANIKWRIVIVSACYSGSYIPPLEGASTLLMTAATSQTTSFGCSNEAENTYFGHALLKTALPQSKDFQQMHEILSEEVFRRETEQNLFFSIPQMSMGKEIEAYLAAHSPFKK